MDELTTALESRNLGDLARLSRSESAEIRLAVAENPFTPDQVLIQLSRDPDSGVRLVASKRTQKGREAEIEEQRRERLAAVTPGGLPRPTLPMTTLTTLPGRRIVSSHGIVFGSSSRIAWGINTQADRLATATAAALIDLERSAKELDATAVVGVAFGLNSSTGSSANILGASEGVVVIGTAVVDEAFE
ncbi:MAG TPA: hypothetical protein VGM70_09575 [Pseudolysinimonas sp.]